MRRGRPVVVTYGNRSKPRFSSVIEAAVALSVSTSTLQSRLKEWQPIQGRDDIRRIEFAEVQE